MKTRGWRKRKKGWSRESGAIRFITGKPGAGKGLMCMHLICQELMDTTRPVLTNLAVELLPWCRADGTPQKGLLSYLQHKYGKTFDAERRVVRLTSEQAAEFYLWRLSPIVPGEKPVLGRSRVTQTKPTDGGRAEIIEKFDLALYQGGHFYCIDEAARFWGSRNWQKTGEGLFFYQEQHRKFSDEVLICCQHTKQIDAAVQRLAQDFWVCRNRSMLRLGMFRQPDDFKVAIFENAPTGSQQAPMHTEKFKLDIKGIAQTYDTSAGVGLAEKMVADVHRKKKGVPWWLLFALIPVGAILLGLFFGEVIPYMSKRAMGLAVGNTKPAAAAPGVQAAPGAVLAAPGAVQAPKTGTLSAAPEPEQVFLTGVWHLGQKAGLMLSDGTMATVASGRITRIDERGCILDGVSYPWAKMQRAATNFARVPSETFQYQGALAVTAEHIPKNESSLFVIKSGASIPRPFSGKAVTISR